MERQDFEVTVRETFEGIERAIDKLSLDGVEAYPQSNGLKLMFDDASTFEFTRNDGTLQIDADMLHTTESFYWDSVEEQWYGRACEQPLARMLGAALSKRLARDVNLADVL